MTSYKTIWVLIVLACLLLSGESVFCYENDVPFDGVKIDKDGYPREEIMKAITPEMERRIEEDAWYLNELNNVTDRKWPVESTSVSLCDSEFITKYPSYWMFPELPKLGKCWVLHYFWTCPLTYVNCKHSKCRNLPCECARNYNCVATNYKTYVIWIWCGSNHFLYHRIRLPQCCECRKFTRFMPSEKSRD